MPENFVLFLFYDQRFTLFKFKVMRQWGKKYGAESESSMLQFTENLDITLLLSHEMQVCQWVPWQRVQSLHVCSYSALP